MTKWEIIRVLREKEGLEKAKAMAVVDILFDEMANALKNGDRVEIRGLFSLYIKKYKEYIGRNPKTGETVKVKPKKLPYFKCGKELKKRVNNY
jgi:integration host factor subunit beta